MGDEGKVEMTIFIRSARYIFLIPGDYLILFYSTFKDAAAAGTRGGGVGLVSHWSALRSPAGSCLRPGVPSQLGQRGPQAWVGLGQESGWGQQKPVKDSREALTLGQRRGWASPPCSFTMTVFKPFPPTIPHQPRERVGRLYVASVHRGGN